MGNLPRSLRTEVPSSNLGYGTPCVINSASLETVLRVITLSQTERLSVFIDSLKQQLWHMNHRIRGQLRYQQFYSVSVGRRQIGRRDDLRNDTTSAR